MNLLLYVGCGLTHAPQEFKDSIAAFKDELRKIPWITLLDFVSPLNGDAWKTMNSLQVYHNDIHECVKNSHVFIADVSYASIGLGWELGTSVEKHQKRTIMCLKEDMTFSHLPNGAPQHSNNPALTLKTYKESITELVSYLIEELKIIHAQL